MKCLLKPDDASLYKGDHRNVLNPTVFWSRFKRSHDNEKHSSLRRYLYVTVSPESSVSGVNGVSRQDPSDTDPFFGSSSTLILLMQNSEVGCG